MYIYIHMYNIFMIIESKLCIYTCVNILQHIHLSLLYHIIMSIVYTMPNYVPLHTCTKRHTSPTFDSSMYSTYHPIGQFDFFSGVTSFHTKISHVGHLALSLFCLRIIMPTRSIG